MNTLKTWLLDLGLAEGQLEVTAALAAFALLLLLSLVAYVVSKRSRSPDQDHLGRRLCRGPAVCQTIAFGARTDPAVGRAISPGQLPIRNNGCPYCDLGLPGHGGTDGL